MLCDRCRRHFDFSVQDYSYVKRETISHLQESGADSALLEFLQADLVTYEHSKQQGPIDACPWIPQQQVMNYLDEAKLSSMSRPRLRVWRSRNVGESLKESMQKGCNICMRICEAVDCLGYDYSDIDIDSQLVLAPVTLFPLEVEIELENGLESEWLIFAMKEDHFEVENQSLVELSGSYKSMDCLDELITCLSECTKNHAECRKTYESSWVPTRLIDIDGYKQNGSVCLVSRDQVVAAQPNTHLRYATLSHVWGGHTFKTLKASNVSDLKYGFPVSGLPKTFAQAIDVTERIGLRYLWIDCLCIIQDSKEDWSIEACLMDKVYLNSFVTLAASLATNPKEGLFWDRKPELGDAFTIEFTSETVWKRFAVFYDLQFLIRHHSPLYKRGWVLQESYLSPRTIHFSKYPAFECREVFDCEAYRTTGTERDAVDRNKADLCFQHTTKTISRTNAISYREWSDIIYDYSRCSLTVVTDKLIAFSGIAKALSPAVGDGYYAGLWKQWWLEGLLWMVAHNSRGYEMPTRRTYAAPSWSWASIEGAILPWGRLRTSISDAFVHLEGISTNPTRGDPFGQLAGGEVRLKGKLFTISQFHQLAEVDRYDLVPFAFSLDDYDDELCDAPTLFLPLVDSPNHSLFPHGWNICGLLLQYDDNGPEAGKVFQRVGFAVISDADGDVARSGYHVDEWISPPWGEEDLEVVVIV